MTASGYPPARWRHLGVGLTGLVAACAAQNGLPVLIVSLRAEGLTLPQVGLLVSAPPAPPVAAVR